MRDGGPAKVAGDERAERSFDLLVAGDLNPDVILTGTPDEVEFGHHERLVGDATLTVGGSAGIMACGAARLGLKTAFVSLVGDDDTGRYVTAELAARGIDVGGVLVQHEAPTGMTVSLVRASGDDRAILTSPGCIPLFDADYGHRRAALFGASPARDLVLPAAEAGADPARTCSSAPTPPGSRPRSTATTTRPTSGTRGCSRSCRTPTCSSPTGAKR